MRRPILAILFLSLWIFIPALMTAQDVQPPVTTEEPAVVTEEPAQIVVPQNVVPIPTSTTGEQNVPPQVAPQSAPPPAAIDPLALPTLISARSDMELLAGEQLGAERPIGWSGSLDVNDPQLPLLTRLDLELLAGRLMAPDQRPVGWFGAVPSTTVSIVRDIRHDLELLADTVGVPNVRPNGWTGADPLIRCERGVQALVNVLERGGVFSLNVDGNDPNFCQLVELQASHFAETNILSSPTTTLATNASNPAAAGASGQSIAFSGSAQIDSAIAIAFLNRYGTEQVGKIPVGTSVEPVARSFTQFSAMTLVRGQDFEVFIDYRDSNLSADQFAVLPNVDNISVNTVCNASWCEPIIYTVGNPAAGRSKPPNMPVANPPASTSPNTTTTAANAGTGDKTQVPVQNLIINYDGQDANNSTVVRMQLCSGTTATVGNVCQPVSLVLAPDGSTLQPVGVLNGENQYRLPYGYSKYSPRTTSYFMFDIWISSPSQR